MMVSGEFAGHPGPGSLGLDEVHLWSAPLTLARVALRRILAGYLGVLEADLALTRTPAGKPCLDGQDGPAFNLSHSGSSAVIAVSARELVGVDIERLRGRAHENLIERALGIEEAAIVRACAPAERELAFLRHWTAKEACLKAWGTGLSGDLRAVRIGDAIECPSLLACPVWLGRPGSSAGTPALGGAPGTLELQHFDPAPDVVGTVAVSGGPWRAVPLSFSADHLG
jgi:4'-phosphopantetheinyl transferase